MATEEAMSATGFRSAASDRQTSEVPWPRLAPSRLNSVENDPRCLAAEHLSGGDITTHVNVGIH